MAATNKTAARAPRPAPRRAPAPEPERIPDPAYIARLEHANGIEPPADALQITTGSRKPGRRVVIFYIDGAAHSVPEHPPAIVTINYLDAVRRHGPMAASTYLLEAMFGPESYAALQGCEDITDEQLGEVIQKVIGILNSAGEAPKELP